MYNEILDAVTRRLNEVFGESYTIYTDNVEQGLQEPCFFVSFLEPSEKQMIGKRYFRDTGLVIQLLPGEVSQLSRVFHEAMERLLDGLEYITLSDGSNVRGTGCKSRVEDGVLTFFVNYNMFVYKPGDREEPMEDLEVKGVVG